MQSAPQVWRTLCVVAGMWALTGEGMFSILEKSTGLWIGRIGPLHPYGWPGREVGWSLHRDAAGKGYAVEAAAATLDYAFDVLGWEDVIHCVAPDNAASAAVAARLGSRNRGPGVLPEPLQDEVVELWGQTRAEWAINRQALAR